MIQKNSLQKSMYEMAVKAYEDYRADFKNNSGLSNFPIFVFADKNECEYFRNFLLKEFSNKNTSVFLNLQIKTLNNFLFETLKNSNRFLKDKKLLTSDILKDLIIYVLNNNLANDITKNYKDLEEFLKSNTIITPDNKDKINLVNLYDLASSLSKLYIEYLENLGEGKDFEFDFLSNSKLMDSINLIDNKWQAELYKRIKEIFNIDNFDNPNNELIHSLEQDNFVESYKNYISLSALYSFVGKNFTSDKKVYCLDNKNVIKPTLYDEILKSLKSSSVVKNIEIFTVENTCTGNLVVTNNNSKFQKLISAPSKIREIEGVHSQICNLIYTNQIDNLDDILILAPNIGDYRNVIHQVFSIAKEQEEKNGIKYPYIPIDLGSVNAESQISNILKILFKIAEKGYYTRKDFFSFLFNSIITEKFDISDDDISSFKEAIDDMNIYRDKPHENKDWQEGRERVLLSMLMDKGSQFCDLSSYDTLFGMGEKCIAKFSTIIELLENWMVIFSKSDKSYLPDDINIDSFDDIIAISKALFLNDVYNEDEEIKNENKILRSLIHKIVELKNLYTRNGSIPYYIFKETILDSIKEINLTDELSKKGGIRLASINLLCPINCKYLFLIGFGSNTFCIENHVNVLDIRPSLNDNFAINLQKRKYENLEIQMAIADKFWVSFTNKDLKKDEDFYLSSEIEEILEKTYSFVIPQENITDDKYMPLGINWKKEKDGDRLWTAREYRNKDYSSFFNT